MEEILEDKRIVSGCLAGDKKSWEAFVGRFSKLIYWSIRKTVEKTPFGGTQELCEEVFQEVFKKLLEKEELSKLRDVNNLRKFLIVLSCHAAMDRLKNLARYERKNISADAKVFGEAFQASFPDALNPREGPAKEALSKEKAALVEETLQNLSPKERCCVEFHYLDGKTHREIGAILGVPQDTVSTVLRRAKEKLRKYLMEKGLSG